MKANLYLLKDYFQCLAVVYDDRSKCNSLSSCHECRENCRQYFKLYEGCLGRLLLEGGFRPDILLSCKESLGAAKEDTELELILRGWLDGDASACRNIKKRPDVCRAMISGNDSLCRGSKGILCKMVTRYSKAIKSGNIGLCGNIENSSIRIMCQAYISGDERICRESPDVLKFRDIYCGKEDKR